VSEPILDPTLRIGRFLLGDVLRSFEGAGQWFIRNITLTTQMTEPLLAEIMGNLMKVRAARFVFDTNSGLVSYEQGRPHPILSYKYVRNPLSFQEANGLINAVCDRAAKLNSDPHYPFDYQTIYLFGSCLTNKEHPGDVDLSLEILFRGGGEIPQPSPIPFTPPGDFAKAARPLYGRGERFKLSFHHHRELFAMGTPYKRIWTKESGIVDGRIIHRRSRPELMAAAARRKRGERTYQQQVDALAARIRAVSKWPKPPVLDLSGVEAIPPSKWRKLQQNPWVLAHAHQMCLPDCPTKRALSRALARCNSRESHYGKRWAASYVKTSMRLNPWTLRSNELLLRKTSTAR
jgi:hypothetical protein